jgi:Phosphotransferase enzyme family
VRTPADRAELTPVLAAAFGGKPRLQDVSRLPGASKKGVYRATFEDGSTAIVYIWADTEDYWLSAGTDRDRDLADPFSHASGLDLFEAAQLRLASLGVRSPRLYLADRSHQHYPADVAVVEDIPGPTLEHLLDSSDPRGRPAAEQLGEAIRLLHADKAARFGKLLHVAGGGVSHGESCTQVVLDRALRDLSESSARDPRIARRRDELAETLRAQAAAVEPRSEYSLIHGELGPDHVLVDVLGQPVVIDIEGLMYFDAEWEHVFLQLRFGRDYPLLKPGVLDPNRLRFYRLAMHLSLVAGPLRLLDGDYPERDVMLDIAEYNLGRVLALVHPAG